MAKCNYAVGIIEMLPYLKTLTADCSRPTNLAVPQTPHAPVITNPETNQAIKQLIMARSNPSRNNQNNFNQKTYNDNKYKKSEPVPRESLTNFQVSEYVDYG